MTIVLLKLLSSEHTSWASGLSRPDAIETKIAPLQNMVILRLIPIPIIPFPILKFPSENNAIYRLAGHGHVFTCADEVASRSRRRASRDVLRSHVEDKQGRAQVSRDVLRCKQGRAQVYSTLEAGTCLGASYGTCLKFKQGRAQVHAVQAETCSGEQGRAQVQAGTCSGVQAGTCSGACKQRRA
jgi:hypothetical protein